MTSNQFSVLELLRDDFLIPFEQLDKFDQLSLREVKKMIDYEGDILIFLGKEISTKSFLLLNHNSDLSTSTSLVN